MKHTNMYTRTTLSNGMRVIFVPQSTSLTATVMVLVEAGSKYESKKLNGISHFLEHMCFKGTTKRPKPIDIAGELDGLGAAYNAFTGHESTSYFAKARHESLERLIDIVADLYLNPTFPREEIEKEKGVIIEEINMYEDLPQRRVQELFMELVYGDQPAGWSIAGEKEVIRHITREDFITYRSAHYLAQATTVVVAGKFSPRVATTLIKKHFGTIRTGTKGVKVRVHEKQSVPQERIQYKESDQTHLVMGFRAFDAFDKRRYALEVLADILGGGMGSRLFQTVREELGAAYYVRAGVDLFSDHGLLAMSAGVHHEKLETVIRASLKEFSRFVTEKVPAAELARAKEHITGGLFLSLETSDDLASYYGGQEIMRLPLETPEFVAERIRAVTAGDIQRVARALIRPDRLSLALIGPYKNRSFKRILKV
jgi:predicted Zn-dependent peptidase